MNTKKTNQNSGALSYASLTFARCICSLFLASADSAILFVKATLTLLNWLHISLLERQTD